MEAEVKGGGAFTVVDVEFYIDITEQPRPPAPPANTARLFVRDRGGKSELCVRFPTGPIRVLATEA
jgi:hypothetical protein